jgi:hypothetical protein
MYQNGAPLLTECDNPTEGGHHGNFDASLLPNIYESSSYIEAIGSDWVGDLQRMYTRNSPVDYVAPGQTSDDYGFGTCSNPANKPWFSGFRIHKWVTAGWHATVEGRRYDNVIEMKAQMDVPRSHAKELVQLELIAYFRRWALHEYDYDAVNDTLVFAPSAIAAKGGESGMAKIFTNVDGSFAASLLSFHVEGSPIARDDPSTASIYEASTVQPASYSARTESPYIARFLQTDWHFSYPSPHVAVHSFFVLGSLSSVQEALQAITREVKANPSPYGLDIAY